MVSAPVVVGSGPVKVLALHGWFGSATGWGSLPELVHEDRYSYLFLDYRGYGARRGETGEFTLAEISADALAAVDSLGWSSFAVLGHSMGGSAMQRVLLDAGDRVSGLIGVSPVPSTGVPFDEQAGQLFRGAAASRDNRYAIIDLTTGNRLSRTWVAPSHDEKVAGSRSTRSTSACRSTSQKPGPAGKPCSAGSSTQTTGPSARSRRNAASGGPVS